MLQSHQHSPQRCSYYPKQNINNLFRKTLMSIKQRKQTDKNEDPIICNTHSIQPKSHQMTQKQIQKQFLSSSYQATQTKSMEKRKEVLNKTFNRTKTDLAHNFVGRKYFVQVEEQRKNSSLTYVAPFKRSCQKHNISSCTPIKHHIQHQNIVEVVKNTLEKKEKAKLFANNQSKRYQNFLKLKKKAIPKKIERFQRIEKDKSPLKKVNNREYQTQNTEISPWDSLGNNSSWLNPY